MVVLEREFLLILGFPSGEIETGMVGGTACYKTQKEVTLCLSLFGFLQLSNFSFSSRLLGRRCRVSRDMIMFCLNHDIYIRILYVII